ncbi:ATP-binding cassette sub-family A member 5-like [Sitophilus oryzae]|uniref:ATP-binding cassette sub-family A member 5-like n=1 Tax=Sitophilus oryzae TaxID=7048 RepID=A0A6J2X8X1_SITOR|nr:ATP-binding cassette sub-family A member 5-like [Sitophilus oryzae]XP_030747415.1 ATP-binding cassette sub-family A member 5-like [Sitophilus oryzae]
MGDQGRWRIYLAQLRAMLKRNLLLKKRDRRRTLAEVLLPIYTLGVLFLIKIAMPNPNFPEMNRPRGEAELLANFRNFSHSVAVVPNSTEVQDFLRTIDDLWDNINAKQQRRVPPIAWVIYPSIEELLTAYWMEPNDIPIAVIFQNSDPINNPLSYEIRTNPNIYGTPSTTQLFSSPAKCREYNSFWQHVPGVPTPVLPEAIEVGESCPVNQYYYSGFLALQALIDFTKIKLDAGIENLDVPSILLEMFPKSSYTGSWMVIVRVLIPFYTVIALSQFITYLLILIVGEKEKKIKEGMKIMGLYDSVFWLSWFIIYAIFVLLLTIIYCSLVFALNIFTNTSFGMIFLLIFMYSLSIIMFGFMITPFFDKSRTAGILGNFAVTILSLFYFIQVFARDSSSIALWMVSLISPAGFALAMDKALLMDLAGQGVNLSNVWDGPDMPFGGSLIMMAVDVVLYGFIAYYLDNVVPSEHGVKRSPFFCFNPSFWCTKRPANKIPLSNGESLGSVGSLNTGEEVLTDFEPLPREMKGREAIKIVDLYKSFHHFRKPEVKAINGINLTIYQGHITAILGHNGAGKTTLFNILTGLTAPTSGTAYIFGYDVRNQNEMDQIRRMTGVCPQHDILFDNLTPKEHLEFFANVKGIPSSKIEQEVSKTLKDVDLTEKANAFARHLSGGQKRKLSVGIAVIGDPKIVILDEPTAGVDPYSRRHMWNLLQSRRHGKIILLTTHFMDEADILADRKAVVSKGSIRCCGSSLFLKNKFGIGYHLTLVLEGNPKEQAIARLVTTHVPKAEKARRHGRELSFILPHNAVDNFASLFSAIELEINNKSSKIGISSYGVSMTTLEEVFLHLEKGEDEPDEAVENLSKKIVRNRALSRSLSLQSKSTSYQSLQNEGNSLLSNGQDSKGGGDVTEIGCLEAISETKSPITGIGLEKIECNPNAYQTILALVKLRTLRLCRDLQKLYFMILLPLLCAVLSLYFNNYFQSAESISKSLELNGTTYEGMSTIAIHNESSSDITQFIDQLINLGVRQIDTYDGNFSSLLSFAPHLAAFNIYSFSDNDYKITILYNDTFQHSLPITLNLISNSIYRLLTPDKILYGNFEPIKVMTQPFQQTMQPEGLNVAATTATICVGTVFVMIPISLAIDLVYDREMKTKNQLRVNGLSTSTYFLTYFLVLCVIMVVICAILVIIMVAFDIPGLREWPSIVTFSVLIFLYCPSSILSCTCLSYIFDKTDSAQSILPNIATFIGWIPSIFVIGLDVMNVGKQIAMILHCLFSLTNTMYIPCAILYYIQRVYRLCSINLACDRLNLASYCTPEIIILLVGMIVNIPLWFMLLRVVDVVKSGGRASDAFQFLQKNKTEDISEIIDSDVGTNEDQDVKDEKNKVLNLTAMHDGTPPVVMVQNLNKVYKNQTKGSSCCKFDDEEEKIKVAVKSLSLAVDAGEVFGLLGHNGAGKTTTMKIITAEEAPTRGKVYIGGQSITSNLNSAFQLLGYCPQHDALWRNITVREHLEIYAAIRGVPYEDIDRIVNNYINGLQIHDHVDKQVKQCSGGTKRKLSFAMSMIGNPKIVLLDEPSTGMDPRSKRFLWDTILASFQGSRGAILTTHSMEEADALCSRVGIMVKGELRCLGSTQHLKNLYGAGYTLEMKLKGGESTPTSETGDRLEQLKEFVLELFPDATLQETFVDRLVFSVPQQSVPSLANCFMQLEKAKLELEIEEYSFSQTTLEQVFLKFAQYDEVNGE